MRRNLKFSSAIWKRVGNLAREAMAAVHPGSRRAKFNSPVRRAGCAGAAAYVAASLIRTETARVTHDASATQFSSFSRKCVFISSS